MHITLPGHDLMLALKTANALLSIELDGDSQLALPKQVQRDPIKGFIEHADLILVRRGEKVTVDVPLVLVGEAAPDALVTVDHNAIPLEAEATHIPSRVEVDIEGLEVGAQILAKDLVLPEGATLGARRGGPDRQRHAPPRRPRTSRPSSPRPRPRSASSTT